MHLNVVFYHDGSFLSSQTFEEVLGGFFEKKKKNGFFIPLSYNVPCKYVVVVRGAGVFAYHDLCVRSEEFLETLVIMCIMRSVQLERKKRIII